MSYCRYSADDYRSDVYAYDSEDGVVVCFAEAHCAIDLDALPPLVPVGELGWVEALSECSRAASDQIRDRRDEPGFRTPLPEQYRGRIIVTDHADAADLLEQAAADGVWIPAGVVEQLREEAAEIAAQEEDNQEG